MMLETNKTNKIQRENGVQKIKEFRQSHQLLMTLDYLYVQRLYGGMAVFDEQDIVR